MGGGQGFNPMGRNNMGAPQQQRAQVVEQGNAQNGINGLRCYNCNEKGYLDNACQKLRIRGSAYHKEALLLAHKDEAGGTLTNKEHSFMANADSDDDMEDLQANAEVMLMANMQELHMSDTSPVYDTDGLSKVSDQTIFIKDLLSSPTSASDKD